MDIGLSYGSNAFYDDFFAFLLKSADYVIRIPQYLFGIVGLILLMPLVAIFTIFVTVLVYSQKLVIKRAIKILYNQVGSYSEEELIQSHLDIERIVFRYRSAVDKQKDTKDFFLYKPIQSQAVQILGYLNEAEKTLKKAAYPDIDKPLTEKDKKELLKLSGDFEDWKDEKLDIYGKVYC